ncbi:BrnT family toxin [Chelatococcus sambhunathii]|uniref:BrnT family toxin n=1 Tax=Chelatococcus sambhunathii TaxID=363953 RepID=A0ABU1DCH7_9HYPH|nr:BrnT family toxin [Chelatococcus sambhunathii]MDR4305820.1 BrnT family toxin [Chelatococcus sambhunathii]
MFDPNPVKSDANMRKHGLTFEQAEGFDWSSALESRDERKPYLEVRTVAVGFVGSRLCVLTFTRRGQRIRIISFRKANDREADRFERFYR